MAGFSFSTFPGGSLVNASTHKWKVLFLSIPRWKSSEILPHSSGKYCFLSPSVPGGSLVKLLHFEEAPPLRADVVRTVDGSDVGEVTEVTVHFRRVRVEKSGENTRGRQTSAVQSVKG